MIYYAVIKKKGKIIQKDITSIKSVAFDILKKEMELDAIRNQHNKSYLKMQLKELKNRDKTELINIKYEIVKKDD